MSNQLQGHFTTGRRCVSGNQTDSNCPILTVVVNSYQMAATQLTTLEGRKYNLWQAGAKPAV
jgi:hypothetical protein